jgi:Sulfotransferase family
LLCRIDVWKSGGTTIENQLHKPQVAIEDIQNHSEWISFVRDPIDHFLSGYSECQLRYYAKNHGPLPAWDEADYDRRIREWLHKVQSKTQIYVNMCTLHSFPQANFFLDPQRGRGSKLYANIKAIGDMSELPALLERIATFPYNYSQPSSNVAATNRIKMQYYPARRDLLSNATLRAICRFVSLDYHFFNFQPPDTCQQPGVLVTPQHRPMPLKAGEHYELPKAVQPRIRARPLEVTAGRLIAPAANKQQSQQKQTRNAKTLGKYNKQLTVHHLLEQRRNEKKTPISLH